MIGRLLICIGALAALSSCSADGGADSSKVTLDLGTEVATAPPLPVPSTEPKTPAEPAATTSPTTAATTTEPTTTTTIDPKAEVAAAFMATVEVRKECDFDPQNCAFDLISLPDSPQDRYVRETMAIRLGGNLRAVEGFGSLRIRVDDVVLGGDVAFVTTCSFDTIVLFDVGDPNNQADDVIFDDSIGSRRVNWEMRRVSGTWLRYQGTNLEKLTGSDLCVL